MRRFQHRLHDGERFLLAQLARQAFPAEQALAQALVVEGHIAGLSRRQRQRQPGNAGAHGIEGFVSLSKETKPCASAAGTHARKAPAVVTVSYPA